MNKNYPVAIVGFILFMFANCLIMGMILTAIEWLLMITIDLKIAVAWGFILFILQLLMASKD